jgi:hypothetical protein
MQQQCLRIISDSFKAMSTQILEVEIYVKLIQLHLTHLQIKFRQRMKKKQHDVFISSFCNKIKNNLTTQRDKRRRWVVKTSNEKKQKWSAKLAKKMRKRTKWTKNRSRKRDINSFELNNSRHETLIRRKIDVAFARRWQMTSRARNWNCTKSWRSQKALSSRTYVRDALSSLIICYFDACLLCYRLTAFATILDKRSSTYYFSTWTEQQTDNACLTSTKRRMYASYWTSRRNSKRR